MQLQSSQYIGSQQQFGEGTVKAIVGKIRTGGISHTYSMRALVFLKTQTLQHVRLTAARLPGQVVYSQFIKWTWTFLQRNWRPAGKKLQLLCAGIPGLFLSEDLFQACSSYTSVQPTEERNVLRLHRHQSFSQGRELEWCPSFAVTLTGRALHTGELTVHTAVSWAGAGPCGALHPPRPQDNLSQLSQLAAAKELAASSHVVAALVPPLWPQLYLTGQQQVLMDTVLSDSRNGE